jgi:enoyl-CoA hydratase
MTHTIDRRDRVALVTIDRPEVLNALNGQLMNTQVAELIELDSCDDVGCIVVTGSQRAFAAGADVSEMRQLDHLSAFNQDFLARWDRFAQLRTPKIAAVAGYALGGGCELAMACDTIFADESARFGQPEITLGLIPGMGGTQRLVRAVGKALAMDLILTGRMIDAREAHRAGLVARVVETGTVVDVAIEAAATIAAYAKPTAMMAREAVNRAFESSLAEGLLFERRSYQAIFGTPAAAEGIGAFLDKRPPMFEH